MDLFSPLIPEGRRHPHFVAFLQKIFRFERDVLLSWANGFVDRDGKFVQEFQSSFTSAFWELYLHAAFRELGFTIDFSYAAPDFLIEKKGNRLVAEATTANHAEGFTPEWEAVNLLETGLKPDLEEMLRMSTIRLANAIAGKHKKLVDHYQKLPHVSDTPFILCVAPFEQPFFTLQGTQAIRRVLYGYDGPIYKDFPEKGERVVYGETGITEILKDSGASIPLGLFLNDSMSDISAVIFSNTATSTKVRALSLGNDRLILFHALRYNPDSPHSDSVVAFKKNYVETLLEGIHVFLNPFAKNPIEPSLFRCPEIAIHSIDLEKGEYLCEMDRGFLLHHQCIAFHPSGSGLEPAVNKGKLKEYKQQVKPSYAEGKLTPVGGYVACFVDQHLAHYRGWTILVACDEIDSDWSAIANESISLTVPEFIEKNRNSAIRNCICPDWYPSKEEAFEQIKRMIDERTEINMS